MDFVSLMDFVDVRFGCQESLMPRMSGMTALVTGASRGLGRAIALGIRQGRGPGGRVFQTTLPNGAAWYCGSYGAANP